MPDFSSTFLDAQYNNRNRVAGAARHVENWAACYNQIIEQTPVVCDVAYGDSADELVDIFLPPTDNAPVFIFVHGGYWSQLSKNDSAFVAPSLQKKGICVVVVNYSLCPKVSIADIVRQIEKCSLWVYQNIGQYGGHPQRLLLGGHSAGGHLSALMATKDWSSQQSNLPQSLFVAALSISGLHDLSPVAQVPFLQPTIRLSEVDAYELSPVHKAPLCPIALVVGALESEEFIRQTTLLQQAWGNQVLTTDILPEENHFTIVEQLQDSDSILCQRVCTLLDLH